MDGKFIIPGIYTAKNQRWNLLAFNDTPHIQFVYRENMIVKSRDIFTAENDHFESVNKRNISLKEILDNTESPTECQTALKKFYEQKSNTEHIYVISDDTQKIHAQQHKRKVR